MSNCLLGFCTLPAVQQVSCRCPKCIIALICCWPAVAQLVVCVHSKLMSCVQALRSPLLAATISHLQHACLTSPWTVRVSGAQALAKVMRWILASA